MDVVKKKEDDVELIPSMNKKTRNKHRIGHQLISRH